MLNRFVFLSNIFRVKEEKHISPSTIRFRGMAVGVLLSGVIAAGIPYGEFVIKGARLGLSSSTPAALFLLFLLVVIVQPVLGTVRRSWLLTRGELLLVTVMMMLASAIPSRGFSGPTLGMVAGAIYYATPENDWAEQLIPYIPTWVVNHDAESVRSFHEGIAAGQAIPWAAWLEPLSLWLLFMAAFYTVLICSMVIMRRQWMENERLLYPLTQVPLGMIEDGEESSSRIKPFMKNPVLWAGFAVPFLINSVNALSGYYEFVPRLNIEHRFFMAANTVELLIRPNFMIMGLAYFINTGIAFSMWLFFLLAKSQEAVCSVVGLHNTERLDAFSHTYNSPTMGILSHQTMGAMIVVVSVGLWTARAHLGNVFRQVVRGVRDRDHGEILSYRAAAIGLLAGLAVMAVWIWRSGMPPWATALYLFGTFVIFLALTRVIVEAGLSSAVAGVSAAGFLVSGVGASSLGTTGMLATGFTLAWAGDLLVFMMAPVANGLRMLHGLQKYRYRILCMMALALAISLVGSLYTTLQLGYRYGAINLGGYFAGGWASEPMELASRLLSPPTEPYMPGWIWTGVGAAVAALLILAKQRLPGWPLHPIGFLAGGTWILGAVWSSIFVAWVVKASVLKYSGPRGYRITRWFFLGLILGQVVAGGFWMVVDGFTGMRGSRWIWMY